MTTTSAHDHEFTNVGANDRSDAFGVPRALVRANVRPSGEEKAKTKD
jgi:hypothetical protein